MLGEKKFINDEELILFHEIDKKNVFQFVESKEVLEEDYEPETVKRDKYEFILL